MRLDLKQISLALVVIMFVSSAIGGLILWQTGFSFHHADQEAERIGHWNEENISQLMVDAKSANITLDMKVGTLTIESGTKNQLNIRDAYPTINHSLHNGVADIKISQEGHKKRYFLEDLKNVWHLQLNRDFPLNLTVNLGLVDANLRLGSLNLTRFNLDIAMGRAHIDISDTPTLRWISVDNTAGDVTLDLRGDWKRDLNVTVDVSMGDIEVMLPPNIGVCISADGHLSSNEHSRLKRMGEYYVNEAFGRSEPSLYLDLSANMGDIEIR